MKRLAGAVQANRQDVGASVFQREAAVVCALHLLLDVGDGHLRPLLRANAASRTLVLQAKVHGAVLVLVLFRQLPLVPAMQEKQDDRYADDGYTTHG